MALYSKRKLSGSTDGKQIKVAAIATPGTTIHTAVTGTTDFDEIYIWATNQDTVDRSLTIEWGGVTSPDDLITMTVPAKQGYVIVIPGVILQNGLLVRAFASVANVILINGFVNRITA